ncbi:MAG: hypothetical protein ACKO4Z_04170 [Planctomycetota bacterium]
MNARIAPRTISLLLLVAALVVESTAAGDAPGQAPTPLKWTPHRTATAAQQPADQPAAPASAVPATTASTPTAPAPQAADVG